MKKICAVLTMALVMLGCSGNQIEIRNEAAGGVYFLFRGVQHYVASGASTTISDAIPNRTYPYSTTYELPPGYDNSDATSDLSGTLSFYRNQTQYVLLYGSTYGSDSLGSIYHINCNVSSNDPVDGF
jgi:hypothetical protein